MRRFVLTGYYGFGNIGDEAVLLNIIDQIKKNIPDASITVLSNNPQETAAAYDVTAVNRWKIAQTWSALRYSDIFVLGGGSLLQDVTGKRSLAFYLMQIFLARLLRRPVFLYAQGIGPINGVKNQKRVAKALKKSILITVRDEDSACFLKDLGLDQEKIIITADPVLAARKQPCPFPLEPGKKIAIAIRPWPSLSKKMIDNLAFIGDYFADLGYRIVFLPFCEPQDRQIALQVIEIMKCKPFIWPDRFSYASMMGAIGAMDVVLGMRLHSLIMAAASGTPFVGLSYDPKVDSFCRSLQQPVFSVNEFSCQNLIKQIEQVLSEQDKIKDDLAKKKKDWSLICQANAVLLKQAADRDRQLSLESALNAIGSDFKIENNIKKTKYKDAP
ncbi:MAG: polysaccharide pyruvyl transferase CsaB [Bacillota bacterium]|jgi:polysaccharide pyruvyl transferase CsaB